MLESWNLSFSYSKKKQIINQISFSLKGGSVCGILGPNGAGKSTLLYLIAGLLRPDSGHVTLNGEDTRRQLPSTLSSTMIIPEELSLPDISVEHYARINSKFYPNFSMEDFCRHCEEFDIDTSMHFGSMSMGQKKKAYICYALACNTPLLLMDEPTNGLDIESKAKFKRFVAGCMTPEKLILISTHQVRDIDLLLDHIIIMDNERLVLNQSVDSITEKLRFANTSGMTPPTDALFSLPGLEGLSYVAENTDNEITDINLETLFGLAMHQPDRVREMFNVPDPLND